MAANIRSWFECQCRGRCFRGAVAVCVACGLSLIITGCTAHATKKKCPPHDLHDCVICPTGLCGGFYPTCWRLWPADCPTCPVEPATAPVLQPPFDGEPQSPFDGELVLPPSQSAMNRQAKKPGRSLAPISHRRQQPVTTQRRPASPAKSQAGHGRPPTDGESARLAPDSGTSADLRAAYNAINLLPGTTPSASATAAVGGAVGPSPLMTASMHDSAEPPTHAVVSWRFSSAGETAPKRNAPVASIVSDAAPVRLSSGGESPLIDSILAPNHGAPPKTSPDPMVVGPTLPH